VTLHAIGAVGQAISNVVAVLCLHIKGEIIQPSAIFLCAQTGPGTTHWIRSVTNAHQSAVGAPDRRQETVKPAGYPTISLELTVVPIAREVSLGIMPPLNANPAIRIARIVSVPARLIA
jgi:hypothetical protein